MLQDGLLEKKKRKILSGFLFSGSFLMGPGGVESVFFWRVRGRLMQFPRIGAGVLLAQGT